MAPLTYYAVDLATMKPRGTMPLRGVSWEDVLRAPGSLSGTLAGRDAYAARGLLDLQDTAVVAMSGTDTVEWGGILSSLASTRSGGLQLGAVGHLGYWDSRTLNSTATYPSWDEAAIVGHLAQYVVDLGGPPYRVDLTPTGRLRDRVYEGAERPVIGTLLKQLMEVENGPDVSVQVTAERDADGTYVFPATVRTQVRQGSRGGQVLDAARDITDYTVTYQRYATHATAVSDQQDTGRLAAEASIPAPVRWDATTSRSGVSSLDTLQQWADRLLGVGIESSVLVAVDVKAGLPQPIGVGDDVKVRINQPGGFDVIDQAMRVLSRKVTVSDSGLRKVSLAFVQPTLGGD